MRKFGAMAKPATSGRLTGALQLGPGGGGDGGGDDGPTPPAIPERADAALFMRRSRRQPGQMPCSSRHVAQIVCMQSWHTATDGTAL